MKNNRDDDKRILDYWAKLYRETKEIGGKYKDMKRTIVIYITTYDVEGLKNIEDYKTRWSVREEKWNTELTNVLEIDIIELSKAKRLLKKNKFNEERQLSDWIKFLINPNEIGVQKMSDISEKVKEAYKKWQSITDDPVAKDIAERRYLDLASDEYGRECERKLALEEGIKTGIKTGIKQKQIEIAKKMLKDNIDIPIISKYTILTIKEIESLKKKA